MLLTSYEEGNISTTVALTSSSDDQNLAQGIKIYRVTPIGTVYLYLTPSGTPGGYVYVEIQDNSNSALKNGTSEAIPVTSLVTGWNAFTFDRDARPIIADDTQHYVALKHSGYTYSSSNNVKWSCDQSTPHYTRGVGKTYDGATWSAISTGTDFIFKLYSGYRTSVYSKINEVEALVKNLTNLGRFDDSNSPITATAVLDFEETVADAIDGWLKGAGITAPLGSDAQSIVRSYANQCVALECEMTQNTAGFTNQSERTRAGAFKIMCDTLKNDLAEGGPISDALRDEQDDISAGGGDGLTAGMIEDSDRDERDEDTSLIQPIFKNDMWVRT